MEKILFTGPPGAGKGTQSKLLLHHDFQHICTGDLIRKTTDPEILEYLEGINKGGFLPDNLIFQLIEKSIINDNYILDRAIRTLPQAKYAKEKGLIDKVFFLDVKKEICVKRLLEGNRGRVDDNPKAIEKRFNKYQNETKPTLQYLKNNFDFYKLNGEDSIKDVHFQILEILGLE